jgi:hypothetical protein
MTTLIVKTAKGLSQAEGRAAIGRHGANPKASIPQLGLHIVEVPPAAVDAITKDLSGDPSIERVDANNTRKLQGVPSDSLIASQWALPKIGWDTVYGNTSPTSLVKIAVLDTGVDATHPDLSAAVGTGTSILDGSNGWTDPNGHGTWLAGIAAATADNSKGIAGVAYGGVQIMPVQVLSADGTGQDSDIIAGVIWATDNGASVILMGFSSPGFSQSLQDAIDYAWSGGVVLVAAAGNDGLNSATFPAGDKGVIGVSATDTMDNLASLSNYGSTIFLAAPGVDIYGTYPNNGYVSWSGTSASAAIVAGAAGFMRAVDPSLSNGVVVGRLARTADVAGTQEQTGNGRINLARALADTGTDEIQPLGAPPVGDGGPFVGPYVAAAAALNLLPSSGAVGTTVDVTSTASFFDRDASVTITFDGNTVATCTANSGGNLNSGCSFVVPAGSAGSHVVATEGSLTLSATFTITGKLNQATLTVNAPSTLTYGATATLTTTGGSGNGAVTFSVGASTGCTVSGSTLSVTNASGTCSVTATKADDGTYNAITSAPVTVALVKANATVNVTAYDGPYDAAPHGATGTATGVAGANLNSLLHVASTTYTNVPGGPVTWTFDGDNNYNSASGSVDMKIAKVNATVNVSGYTGVYDGTAHGAAERRPASAARISPPASTSARRIRTYPAVRLTGHSLAVQTTTTPAAMFRS